MRVLLLHASLGSGHKRAAEALHEVFDQRGIDSDVMDLLDEIPSPLSRFYSRSYQYMITRRRALWKFVYNTANRPAHPYRPGKSFWQKWQFSGLRKRIQDGGYTHLAATHFTCAALFADWRIDGSIGARIFSVITDHVTHRCWRRKELDHYFVPSEDVALEMRQTGVDPGRITVSGIPISQAFSQPLSREVAREKWSCSPEETVFLLLCSGFDLRYTLMLVRALTERRTCRCLVSTGTDPAKEERVRQEFEGDPRFTIFGFSPLIAEMMSAADLIITKPGGLIVSEALAMGRPQILLAPIPGQEEANARYAVRHGAAICLQEGAELKSALHTILDNGQLQRMTQAARAAGKPDAAVTVVDQILKPPTSE